MNTNFGLGNMRATQLKMQSDMYNSILHNQKMLAEALKHNVARQQAAPVPVPAPVPVRLPLPKKNKFNSLLSNMNEQRKNKE